MSENLEEILKAIFRLLRHRAGDEQPIGDALQDLLPNGCRWCLGVGRSLRLDESLCQVFGRNYQWHPLQVLWFSRPYLGAIPGVCSLKQSSCSASDWWTTPNHGTLHWQCLFSSPCLSRWQRAQATELCLSWKSSSWPWCLHLLVLAGIWELSLLVLPSTNPSATLCSLFRYMQRTCCFGPCWRLATTGRSMVACSMDQRWSLQQRKLRIRRKFGRKCHAKLLFRDWC